MMVRALPLSDELKLMPFISDGSYGPVLVRLAWHSSGTYDKAAGTGGRCVKFNSYTSSSAYDKLSNYATMRFEPEALHGANNGLQIARQLLQKIKTKYPWISYGDLWTLAGVAAVQVSENQPVNFFFLSVSEINDWIASSVLQEMGGPKIPWRPGRIDGFAKDATPDGRLPDASQGADHVRNVSTRIHVSKRCY